MVTAELLEGCPVREGLLVCIEAYFVDLGDVFNVEDGEATLKLFRQLRHILPIRQWQDHAGDLMVLAGG